MKIQEMEKRLWQTPEITDLDVDKTNGGSEPGVHESTTPEIGIS